MSYLIKKVGKEHLEQDYGINILDLRPIPYVNISNGLLFRLYQYYGSYVEVRNSLCKLLGSLENYSDFYF